jgi:hypothetical protein
LLQQFRATACQDARLHFHAVVQGWMVQNLHHGTRSPCFRVWGTVNHAPEPGVNHGTSAHGARFNCNKQLAVSQAMVADRRARLAQGENFRMGGGIVIEDVAIVTSAYDLAVADNDRADGNFSRFEAALRQTKRFLHVEFVGHEFVIW